MVKAKEILAQIKALNELDILKEAIEVDKKAKEKDLAEAYMTAVETLKDDQIPEDVAVFYNTLREEEEAGNAEPTPDVVEEEPVAVVKKNSKEKSAKVEKKAEKKAPVKAEKKVEKKEVTKVEKKPAKIKAEKKVEKKDKKEPSRKFIVYQAWLKKPKTNDKLYELAAGLGLSTLTAKGWINQWAKGNNLPAGI